MLRSKGGITHWESLACSLPHLRVLASAPVPPLSPPAVAALPRSIRRSCFTTPAAPAGERPIDVGGGYEAFFFSRFLLDGILMAERL